MKLLLVLILFLAESLAFAMGSSPIFPENVVSPNEAQHLNDFEETSAGIKQFSSERGYEDQQMMEETKKTKKPVKEQPKQKPLPLEKIPIYHE